MKINFIPLTWIKSKEDLYFQIKNTLIIKRVLEKFRDQKELGKLLKKTQYGFTSSANTHGGNYKMLRITDLKNGKVNWENVPFCNGECDKYLLKKRDIVIARTGNNKSFLIEDVPNNAVFASYLIRLKADENLLLPEYLYIFLNSYIFWSQVIEMQTGTAIPNVNAEKLKKLIVPYCPLEEQRKIINQFFDTNLKQEISKIEKILGYKEDLSSKIKNQNKLLSKLKQSILSEAVSGKLVLQNPKDEPASELLKKIKKEKEKLVRDGKIKKGKELPEIEDDEMPYELPTGWVWCRFNDLIDFTKKYPMKRGPFGSSIKKSFFVPKRENTYKVYEQYNAIYNDMNFGRYYINQDKFNELKAFEVGSGDLIISCSGTIGKIGFIPENVEKGIINQALLKICINENVLSKEYFAMLFESYIMNTDKLTDLKGTAIKNIPGVAVLKKMPIPLPPLAEQRRIVEKVDRLMALCDELELKIKENKKNSVVLMGAVLREVFGNGK